MEIEVVADPVYCKAMEQKQRYAMLHCQRQYLFDALSTVESGCTDEVLPFVESLEYDVTFFRRKFLSMAAKSILNATWMKRGDPVEITLEDPMWKTVYKIMSNSSDCALLVDTIALMMNNPFCRTKALVTMDPLYMSKLLMSILGRRVRERNAKCHVCHSSVSVKDVFFECGHCAHLEC